MHPLIVAAGIIVNAGKVLLSQRKPTAHLAGMWEFPGGKVELDEDPRDALVRELREELGISVEVGDILEVTHFRYPERVVLLLFYKATILPESSAPRSLEVADFRWARGDELDPSVFPPADLPVLSKVQTLLRS